MSTTPISSEKVKHVAWPTVNAVLPKPSEDSYLMTALKVLSLIISLPIAFGIDLIKKTAALFQGEKPEETQKNEEEPKLGLKDRVKKFFNDSAEKVKNGSLASWNFVKENKIATVLALGMTSAAVYGVWKYSGTVISYLPSMPSYFSNGNPGSTPSNPPSVDKTIPSTGSKSTILAGNDVPRPASEANIPIKN